MENRKQVTIYTDGACSGNPGPGGWAAILECDGHRLELSGYEEKTTNNRMEMQAPIQAMRRLKYPCEVNVYSDSAYLIDSINKNWLKNWQARNWLKSDKKPVENQDLWKELLELMAVHRVRWNKVRAHASDERNNRCDELARDAIKKRGGLM